VEHPLDSPVWTALSSLHRAVSLGSGVALRFPPDIAPFLGVPGPGPIDEATLEALVPPGDTVFLLGPAPAAPPGWALEHLGPLHQMVCEQKVLVAGGAPLRELGPAHHPAVLALTALVYPHYFRPRVTELGRYFGIFEGGRLAAMVGERMGAPGFRELSAVCSHPDFGGRGHARRLLTWLANDNLDKGLVPFLHVAPANARAVRLYLDNGFRVRAELQFWSLTRAGR
jgi:GNAT superfamily N-acetyltransferase